MLVAEMQVTHSVYQRGQPLTGTGGEHNLYEGQVLTGLLQDAAARKEVITQDGCVK